MRAWFINDSESSGHLELGDASSQPVCRTEVEIAVRAIGVNRADLLQRRGLYPPPAGFDPRRPGLEYAGEVVAVGDDCQLRRVGDRVMGLVGGGAYAERIVVHERETIAVPAGLEFAAAAAVPEAFATAERALFQEAGLGAGQWALIRGATSGVGQAALQLTRALGARAIATSRSRERLEALAACFESNGLGDAFDLSLTDGEDGVAKRVQAETDGAHVLLDFIGGPVLADNLAALRAEGCQVQVGVIGGPRADFNLGRLLMGRQRLVAMTMRSLAIERRIATARRFEAQLVPLFEAGRLAPIVDQRFPFEAASEAHAAMEEGKHLGKLVLTV